MLRPHNPSKNLLPAVSLTDASPDDLADVHVIEVPFLKPQPEPVALAATPNGRSAAMNPRLPGGTKEKPATTSP